MIDEATSRVYVVVREELRAAGTPIPENDVWIASLVRQTGLPLLSDDAHFDHVVGVDRRSWRPSDERAKRGSRERFEQALSRVADTEPPQEDRP